MAAESAGMGKTASLLFNLYVRPGSNYTGHLVFQKHR
jgi:hypothetical protein